MTFSTTNMDVQSVFKYILFLLGISLLPKGDLSNITTETTTEQDPCQTHVVIDDETRAFSNSNETDRSDTSLVESWYKLEIANQSAEIPRVCIVGPACGVRIPYHIEFPNEEPGVGETKRAFACGSYLIEGRWDCCVLRKDIQIKHCGHFYVYKLKPLDRGVNVGYCAMRRTDDVEPYTAKTGEKARLTDTYFMHECEDCPPSLNTARDIPNQSHHHIESRDLASVSGENFTRCPEGNWSCADHKKCIPFSYRCDNEFNCEDMSDEVNCSPPDRCPEGLQRCENGDCISPHGECSESSTSTPYTSTTLTTKNEANDGSSIETSSDNSNPTVIHFTIHGNDRDHVNKPGTQHISSSVMETTKSIHQRNDSSQREHRLSSSFSVELPTSYIDFLSTHSILLSTIIPNSSEHLNNNSISQIYEENKSHTTRGDPFSSRPLFSSSSSFSTQKLNEHTGTSYFVSPVKYHTTDNFHTNLNTTVLQSSLTDLFLQSTQSTTLNQPTPTNEMKPFSDQMETSSLKFIDQSSSHSFPLSYTTNTPAIGGNFSTNFLKESSNKDSTSTLNQLPVTITHGSSLEAKTQQSTSSYDLRDTMLTSYNSLSSHQYIPSLLDSSQTNTVLHSPRESKSDVFQRLSKSINPTELSVIKTLQSNESVRAKHISTRPLTYQIVTTKVLHSLDDTSTESTTAHITTVNTATVLPPPLDTNFFDDHLVVFIVVVSVASVLLVVVISYICIKRRLNHRTWTCRQEEYYIKCEKHLLMKSNDRKSLSLDSPMNDQEILEDENQMMEKQSIHLSLEFDECSTAPPSLYDNNDGYIIPIAELDSILAADENTEDTKF